MDYELAKELRDAGFPENTKIMRDYAWVSPEGYSSTEQEKEDWCYAPTLLELIKACGGHLESTTNHQNGWVVKGRIEDVMTPNVFADKALEVAVARLWLEISRNKK